MLKIPDAVERILFSSENALSAFFGGYLNYSAYAKFITKEVEGICKKPVTPSTIVVALSRLNKKSADKKINPFRMNPKVALRDIVIRTNVTEITYTKNPSVEKHIQKISIRDQYPIVFNGIEEITLITKEKDTSSTLFKSFKPKIVIKNLAIITVRFGDEYLEEPNVLFVLFRALALRFVNVIKVMSTYSEVSFVVRQNELQTAISVFDEMSAAVG